MFLSQSTEIEMVDRAAPHCFVQRLFFRERRRNDRLTRWNCELIANLRKEIEQLLKEVAYQERRVEENKSRWEDAEIRSEKHRVSLLSTSSSPRCVVQASNIDWFSNTPKLQSGFNRLGHALSDATEHWNNQLSHLRRQCAELQREKRALGRLLLEKSRKE